MAAARQIQPGPFCFPSSFRVEVPVRVLGGSLAQWPRSSGDEDSPWLCFTILASRAPVGFTRIPSASEGVRWSRDVLLPSRSRPEPLLLPGGPPVAFRDSQQLLVRDPSSGSATPGTGAHREHTDLSLRAASINHGCHPEPLGDSWPGPQGHSFPLRPWSWDFRGISTSHEPTQGINPRDEQRRQIQPSPGRGGQESHRAPATARKLLTPRSALFTETVMQRNKIISQPCCFFPAQPALLGVQLDFHGLFPPLHGN